MTLVLERNDESVSGAPAPVTLTDGTYLSVYSERGPDNLIPHWYVQRHASDGAAIGGPVSLDGDSLSAGSDQVQVLAMANGGYAVSRLDLWVNPLLGTDYGFAIKLQFYAADGTPDGADITVAQGAPSETAFVAGFPNQLTLLDSGNILVSWADSNPSAWVPKLAMYTPDGVSLGMVAVSINELHTYPPQITTLAGGGYLLHWSQPIGDHEEGYFRAFDAANQPIIPATHAGDRVMGAGRLDNGGFVLASIDGSDVAEVQIYDAAGHAVGDAARLGDVVNAYSSVWLAGLSDGGFVAAWGVLGDEGEELLVRRFDASGHALGFEFSLNSGVAHRLRPTDVTASSDGGFVITWAFYDDFGHHTYRSDFSASSDLTKDNYLFGTAGNEVLNGFAGADLLAGGRGDDSYYVDNPGDQAQENANEGTDLVKSSVTFTLGTHVENLVLIGTDAIDGTGNSFDNRIFGNEAANRLSGGWGQDELRGLGGNDVLIGGGGADTMFGGAGDDLYYVDDLGDRVVEASAGVDTGGLDMVRASVTFSLDPFIENLALLGTADLYGEGNDLANILIGNAGANSLRGLGGNDCLNGGTGADRMYGGLGDDAFVVDNAGDKVFELTGEGTDRVLASVSFALGAQAIENLILTGTGAIDGTGNGLVNLLIGNGAANSLDGGDGADRLNGGGGNDILIGGTGADIFIFGLNSGADIVSDFLAADNDRININAYSGGVANGGGVTLSQSGSDTVIDLGGGNTVTVLHTAVAVVTSHILW